MPCVCSRQVYSKTLRVKSEVIQGSSVGPILYIMFIYNIFNIIKSSSIYLFVDDLTISIDITNSFYSNLMQNDIDNI